MAYSASLSATYSLNTHQRFSLHSSRPTKFSCIQRDQQLDFPGIPISINIFSSFSILNSNGKRGDSKIIELETRRRSFFKPSVSAQQESQPYQMHEAIAREESHEIKEGIVTQEFRRGFLLGDCLLRPAMVKVSSGPGKRKPPAVQERLSAQPPSVVGAPRKPIIYSNHIYYFLKLAEVGKKILAPGLVAYLRAS